MKTKMTLTFTTGLIGLATAAFLLTGCGGGDTTTDNVNSVSYQVATTEGSQHITLNEDENLIVGYGCTYGKIYDGDGTYLGSTNATGGEYAYTTISLPQGEYSINLLEEYGTHSDSKGILYYLSSGINIPNISIYQTISVPTRTALLYKLNVTSASTFDIGWSGSYVNIYDSGLNYIGTVSSWPRGKSLSSPITLNAGTYYVVATVSNCKESGSFIINKL